MFWTYALDLCYPKGCCMSLVCVLSQRDRRHWLLRDTNRSGLVRKRVLPCKVPELTSLSNTCTVTVHKCCDCEQLPIFSWNILNPAQCIACASWCTHHFEQNFRAPPGGGPYQSINQFFLKSLGHHDHMTNSLRYDNKQQNHCSGYLLANRQESSSMSTQTKHWCFQSMNSTMTL